MGGGGTDTTSTANAEYPPEFRPLATGAVNQILAAQNANNLSWYTDRYPQNVANLSPIQRVTAEAIPYTLNPSWGLQQMQNMTPGFNTASQNAATIANGANPTYSAALQALSSGGFGTGNPVFPQVPNFGNIQASTVNPAALNQTVFGTSTGNLVNNMRSQINGTISKAPVLNTDRLISGATPPPAAAPAPNFNGAIGHTSSAPGANTLQQYLNNINQQQQVLHPTLPQYLIGNNGVNVYQPG